MKTQGPTFLHGGSVPLIAPDLLTEILSTASDIALLASAEGRILSVLINPNHRTFGQLGHWVGKPLSEVLTVESVAKLDARLVQLAEAGGGGKGGRRPVAAELNHRDDGEWEFPVRYSLHRIEPDGSLLMLGRDLRPMAEVQQQLVQAQLALEQDYEAQREMDTRYRVLMEVVDDAVMLVSVGNGRIVDINAAAARMLGGTRAEMIGGAVAQEFEGRRRGELLDHLTGLAVDDASAPVELQARRSNRRVMIVPRMFRAGGERLLMCRIEGPAHRVIVRDDLGESLARLFHEGVDGIVFTDAEGAIVAANEAFASLADTAGGRAMRGRPLSDFLARGTVDMKVLLDNARRAGRMKLYSTRLLTDFAGHVPVEISATWLDDKAAGSLVLVVRDASRAEAMRRPGVPVAEDGMRSVMELVGSSSLREIVAETTDVVEKMCIETAVELTRNNRVAAAEMLGLSRQSLYVKLRKYGLLSRDTD